MVEIQGALERSTPGTDVWFKATVGLELRDGDRVRTMEASRATIQFTDRSVLRIGPSSLVQVQAPKRATASKRFRLGFGRLFFLDREQPGDIEFETPLADGAIRGTEFTLESEADPPRDRVSILDGAVALNTDSGVVEVKGGQEAILFPGQPVQIRSILVATDVMQWWLSYPGVLDPDVLTGPGTASEPWARSLAAWRLGDLGEALAQASKAPEPASPTLRAYLANLWLIAGEVTRAKDLLDTLPSEEPSARAVREVIAAVQQSDIPIDDAPLTASERVARSYLWQSQSRLTAALRAAEAAVEAAPGFGLAWIRLAELHHAFGFRSRADAAVARGLRLAPRHAAGHVLRGFIQLDAGRLGEAEAAFAEALHWDRSLGNAWLGHALVLERRRLKEEGRRALQIAAALDPNRSELRSFLGKAWAEEGDAERAREELDHAKRLDPGDPTPWLYSALEHHQSGRLNDAVRDLETSLERNDHRAFFRSPLLLDRDRSIRSADLAALYQDVGLIESAERAAARAVQEDYANFSGHLFLSRALQSHEGLFDLRFETTRQSELLMANLLAPVGAGNLSQLLSQQDHVRYFGPRPTALSTFTQYGSDGDWVQRASAFGSLGRFGYAIDSEFLKLNGDHANGDFDRRVVSVQVKQGVGPDDDLYLQAMVGNTTSGDIARHWDPDEGDPGLRVEERQEPHLYAGWHHSWSPGHHTLFLAARLADDFSLQDENHAVPFLRRTGGLVTAVDTERGRFDLQQHSEFTLSSFELQQIWESSSFGALAGVRYQSGTVETDATLAGPLPPPFAVQQVDARLERTDVYADVFWRPVSGLRLTAGLGWDHLRLPRNVDLPPLRDGTETRDLAAPRVGLTWSPGPRTQVRAAYSQALGGLYFDDSIRLEPTQVAGFTTGYRSLAPESVVGLVPGSRLEVAGIGCDHSTAGGFHAGVTITWMRSEGEREVGAASNSLPLPLPDTPDATLETLEFQERTLELYLRQIIGRRWSAGVAYRLSEAELTTRYPWLPPDAAGVQDFEEDATSLLQTLGLQLMYHHEKGWFAEWRTEWSHQENHGAAPQDRTEDFWQHHVFAGYRFPRRRAEIRLGVINLTDADDRLNPLNYLPELPRERTFTASLRLNF